VKLLSLKKQVVSLPKELSDEEFYLPGATTAIFSESSGLLF
jgi:hypothetical protein